MRDGTKNQFYKYSMRTVETAYFYCGAEVVLMKVLPPTDALTIENLNIAHFRILFGATVPSIKQKVIRIGVVDIVPGSGYFTNPNAYIPSYPYLTLPTWHKYIDCDLPADGSRILDFKCDVSSIIDKTRPSDNIVYIQLPTKSSSSEPFGGTITVWKMDATYTTLGIH